MGGNNLEVFWPIWACMCRLMPTQVQQYQISIELRKWNQTKLAGSPKGQTFFTITCRQVDYHTNFLCWAFKRSDPSTKVNVERQILIYCTHFRFFCEVFEIVFSIMKRL